MHPVQPVHSHTYIANCTSQLQAPAIPRVNMAQSHYDGNIKVEGPDGEGFVLVNHRSNSLGLDITFSLSDDEKLRYGPSFNEAVSFRPQLSPLLTSVSPSLVEENMFEYVDYTAANLPVGLSPEWYNAQQSVGLPAGSPGLGIPSLESPSHGSLHMSPNAYSARLNPLGEPGFSPSTPSSSSPDLQGSPYSTAGSPLTPLSAPGSSIVPNLTLHPLDTQSDNDSHQPPYYRPHNHNRNVSDPGPLRPGVLPLHPRYGDIPSPIAVPQLLISTHNTMESEYDKETWHLSQSTSDLSLHSPVPQLPCDNPPTLSPVVLWGPAPQTRLAYGPFVPQIPYTPQTTSDRRRYVEDVVLDKDIEFSTDNGNGIEDGIPLFNALSGRFLGLIGRDDLMFEGRGPSISVRLGWVGYQPWSRQIPTRDFKSPPGPITRAKLAKNVAKSISRFIEEFKGREIATGCDPRWKVGGEDGINIPDLILVKLVHVSMGSWQADLRLSHTL